jgi:hypothetical protein
MTGTSFGISDAYKCQPLSGSSDVNTASNWLIELVQLSNSVIMNALNGDGKQTK